MRKTTKIFTGTLFAVAISAVFTQPAQAKSGMIANYQYVNVTAALANNVDQVFEGHGLKVDFRWSLTGYYPGKKIPQHSLGFGLGVGGITEIKEILHGQEFVYSRNSIPLDGRFVSVTFLSYEYVFPFGLGLSIGLGEYTVFANYARICNSVVLSGGITDLGLRYHLKNGLVFSFSSDLMGTSSVETCGSGEFRGRRSFNANKSNLLYAIGAGIGYWF